MFDNDVSAERRRQLQAAGRKSAEVRRRKAAEKLKALVEDIEFLRDPFWGGETDPDVIARRVGYEKTNSLARHLYRCGHEDLACVFGYNDDSQEIKRRWREKNHEKDLQHKRDSRRRIRQRGAAA